jgi:hypothetical protein
MMNNNAFSWTDYEQLLVARYRAGGHAPETASCFALGEIKAIQTGNHWTDGKPTPTDPHALTIAAMLADLSPDEREGFTERTGILEYDAGMNRAAAEAQAIAGFMARKYPAPEKPVSQGSAAIKKTLAAGIPIKDFYAKSKDNDPAAYTSDLGEIAGIWKQGKRKLKAYLRGSFVVIDVDRKPGKLTALKTYTGCSPLTPCRGPSGTSRVVRSPAMCKRLPAGSICISNMRGRN